MQKILFILSVVVNVAISCAFVIILLIHNSVAYIQVFGSTNTKIDRDVIALINSEINITEGAQAMFCPHPSGYTILVVYPWYKKQIPEKVKNKVDRILIEVGS